VRGIGVLATESCRKPGNIGKAARGAKLVPQGFGRLAACDAQLFGHLVLRYHTCT